jgi:hypothetical protein
MEAVAVVVADDAMLEGLSRCYCLDFNGGRDDLEFTLIHGGQVELGEDLFV